MKEQEHNTDLETTIQGKNTIQDKLSKQVQPTEYYT